MNRTHCDEVAVSFLNYVNAELRGEIEKRKPAPRRSYRMSISSFFLTGLSGVSAIVLDFLGL